MWKQREIAVEPSMYQYKFKGSLAFFVEQIEMNVNSITLYTPCFESKRSLTAELCRNFDFKENIAKLQGEHGSEFSISLDHESRQYKNPVFMRSNQPKLSTFFHPSMLPLVPHIHFYYDWDVVSVRDLRNLFSFVNAIRTNTVSPAEFTALANDYVAYLAHYVLNRINKCEDLRVVPIRALCEAVMSQDTFTTDAELSRRCQDVLAQNTAYFSGFNPKQAELCELIQGDSTLQVFGSLLHDVQNPNVTLKLRPDDYECGVPYVPAVIDMVMHQYRSVG